MELQKYRFNDTKEHRRYKEVSGIYALIFEDKVIYVGQSKNIRKRLSAHYYIESKMRQCTKERYPNEDSRLNMVAFCNFVKEHMEEIEFIVLPAEIKQLNELEEHYINKHKPRFNYAGVVSKYNPVLRAEAS